MAHSEHHSDSRSAVSALSDVRIDQTSPHGAFHSSPTKGRAKKAMATTARMRAGSGQAFLPDPAVADGDRGVWRRLAHGAPNPYSARIACPSGPVRKSMNAWSTSWFWEAATLAMGYSATTLMSSGISTMSAASPAAVTSVT